MKLRSTWIAENWGGARRRASRPGIPAAGRLPGPELAPARAVAVLVWTTRAFAVTLKREAHGRGTGGSSGWKPAL